MSCKFRIYYLLFQVFIIQILFSCTNKNQSKYSNNDVHSDTLSLIYYGPKGFELDYFPRDVISSNRVKECEIIQEDSSSSRIASKLQFNKHGNMIRDED